MVRDFIESIIRDHDMDLLLVGSYNNFKDIENSNTDSFDLVLSFGGDNDNLKRDPGVPQHKVCSLW